MHEFPRAARFAFCRTAGRASGEDRAGADGDRGRCTASGDSPPEALQGVNPTPPASLPELEKALRDNPASAYRWIEAAEGYDQAGDTTKALFCLHRAEELGPNLPPVWIRASAFYFRPGESGQALEMGARAQAISGDADLFLFQYYDRFVRSTPKVLAALADNPRASVAYFRHFLPKGSPEDAGLAWQQVERLGLADRSIRKEYVDYLLDRGSSIPLKRSGLREPGERGSGVSRFEPHLRWRVRAGFFRHAPGLEGDAGQRCGDGARHCCGERGDGVIPGDLSRNREHRVRQSGPVRVVTPGRYRFTAWLKTEVITTDEGVRFCIADAEAARNLSAQSEVTRGTTDWTEVRIPVTVPAATHLLKISLCRHPAEVRQQDRREGMDRRRFAPGWPTDVNQASLALLAVVVMAFWSALRSDRSVHSGRAFWRMACVRDRSPSLSCCTAW